jgi:curved DNA-binding protein CbpA
MCFVYHRSAAGLIAARTARVRTRTSGPRGTRTNAWHYSTSTCPFLFSLFCTEEGISPDKNPDDASAHERFQKIGHAWDVVQKYYDNPAWGDEDAFYSPFDDDDDDDDSLDEDDAMDFFRYTATLSTKGMRATDIRVGSSSNRLCEAHITVPKDGVCTYHLLPRLLPTTTRSRLPARATGSSWSWTLRVRFPRRRLHVWRGWWRILFLP